MKVFIALSALLAVASAGLIAPATTLLRAPSHDSAIIQSHRFGGNFAYRTDEAHAYASVQPVISTIRRPVGVSYSHGAPIVRATTIEQAAPIQVASYAPALTYTTAHAAPLAYTTAHAAPLAYSGLGYNAYGLGLGYHGYAGHLGAYGLPLSIAKAEEAPAVEIAE